MVVVGRMSLCILRVLLDFSIDYCSIRDYSVMLTFVNLRFREIKNLLYCLGLVNVGIFFVIIFSFLLLVLFGYLIYKWLFFN